jgi:TPR repeat protein
MGSIENIKQLGRQQDKEKTDPAAVSSKTAPAARPLAADELNGRGEVRKQAMDAARAEALAWNQSQAEKGDAYSQCRMGERYRDGEGVARDLRQACAWLAKSAAQGNPRAIKALLELQKNGVLINTQ